MPSKCDAGKRLFVLPLSLSPEQTEDGASVPCPEVNFIHHHYTSSMAESATNDDTHPKGSGRTKQKKTANDVLLRSLPVSARHFWRSCLEEQLSFTQYDLKAVTNFKRSMPGNELLTMALNEIAVTRGRGFFFHILCRDAWTSWPNADMHPESRVPPIPGSVLPEY
jgi:hypothetical protein